MSRWLLLILMVVALVPSPGFSLAQGPDSPNWTYALEWSPDGSMIAVGTMSGLIRIVDAMEQLIITLQSGGAGVSALAWSPDSTQLASAGWSGETTIWDVATGSIVLTLPTPEDLASSPDAPVFAIRWRPDGSYLAGVSGSGLPPTVFVWNMKTGQLAFTDKLPEAYSLAWKPDNSRLAVGALAKIVIYDVAAWQIVGQIEMTRPEYILALDWSPDGTKLAAGRTLLPDFAMVEVWDTTTLQSLQTFEENSNNIVSVAWSPDGSALASAGLDGTVRLLEPSSGETTILVQEATRFYTVAWSPRGDRLIYADVDGAVKTVDVPYRSRTG